MSRARAGGVELWVVTLCVTGLVMSLAGSALCALAPVCTMPCCVAAEPPMCGAHASANITTGHRPRAVMFLADLETTLDFDLESMHPANGVVVLRVISPLLRSDTLSAPRTAPRSPLRRLHVIFDVFRI